MSGFLIGPCGVAPAVVVSGGWATLLPQSGLVNAWPFDTANTTTGTATDVIGAKNATLSNVTLAGSGPSTNLNNAAVFAAASSARGDTTLANLPTAAFSVVMWLNVTGLATSGRVMANSHTDVDANGIQYRFNSSLFQWDAGNGGSSNSVSVGGFSASTWFMATVTYDGTTITPYLGSVAGTTTTMTGPLTAGANNISFGVNPVYSGDFYDGKLAGVAVYNRALSALEVANILAIP